jgi:HD superfamily phosphohydrolase
MFLKKQKNGVKINFLSYKYYKVDNLNKLKIINDPVYGFITIPNALIYDLIQHPYFQRLRRISQMGLSYLVYPGANHTRFHHALGCLHSMQKAIQVLRFKNTEITIEEENALYIAILLHDIGHGPFSHAMEHSIVEDVPHEEISLLFMEQLNIEFNGQLSLAIQIFKGNYSRKFMLQLISSQLDIDRIDYLKRDSFYSGVEEGKVNSDRLIQMMNVVDNTLVVEEKGIYSVEKFLMARRLMYWQVYLHKTSLSAELTLTNILKRAKEIYLKGDLITCNKSLLFFIENKITIENFDVTTLNHFANLDDVDIIGGIKNWQFHEDFTLSTLCKMIITRNLLKIKMLEEKIETPKLQQMIEAFAKEKNITIHEAKYFVFRGKIKNQAYSTEAEPIRILRKNGTIQDVAVLSDQLNLRMLSKQITKYFVCYPKQ